MSEFYVTSLHLDILIFGLDLRCMILQHLDWFWIAVEYSDFGVYVECNCWTARWSVDYQIQYRINKIYTVSINFFNYCHVFKVRFVGKGLRFTDNILLGRNNFLTSRHNFNLSNNDVNLSDLYTDLSDVILTCQVIFLLFLYHINLKSQHKYLTKTEYLRSGCRNAFIQGDPSINGLNIADTANTRQSIQIDFSQFPWPFLIACNCSLLAVCLFTLQNQ